MNLEIKNTTYKQLLWIGMASITLFFAGLTSAVIVRSSESGWQEITMPKTNTQPNKGAAFGGRLLVLF